METKHLKLGRLPSASDPRTLWLPNYLPPSVLTTFREGVALGDQACVVPAIVDWTGKLGTLQMWKNNSIGDCVLGGQGEPDPGLVRPDRPAVHPDRGRCRPGL